ncbi:hypothetical protein PENSPDRAFT_320515 [Peniophora sp. CONT]|nr:hypothetical protein PENSPDRAFT_320515 [Peniophora sp. CONT]
MQLHQVYSERIDRFSTTETNRALIGSCITIHLAWIDPLPFLRGIGVGDAPRHRGGRRGSDAAPHRIGPRTCIHLQSLTSLSTQPHLHLQSPDLLLRTRYTQRPQASCPITLDELSFRQHHPHTSASRSSLWHCTLPFPTRHGGKYSRYVIFHMYECKPDWLCRYSGRTY